MNAKYAAWYENNLIMLKIRNEGLYKKKYGTFEKYLQDRWGFSRIRGHQLMKSAEFIQIAEKTMSQNANQNGELVRIPEVILPKNEGQIRPLLDKLTMPLGIWCQPLFQKWLTLTKMGRLS
ncbi:MAG: hypothetical protein HQK62_05825 [Desulfamplus sp.]|nr:hypothetical protein [Desulfamplus sp.]